jgi:outer membrane autotransporter protein
VSYSDEPDGTQFATFSILDSQQNDITSSFSSQTCSLDGLFYCGEILSVGTFSFTWTPPSTGDHDTTFILNCSPGCAGAQQVITTSVGNQTTQSPPVASAGSDLTVIDSDDNGTEDVAVDGSSSTDPDNDIVSYQWLEGEQALTTGVNPTLSLAVGSHTITLVVTDAAGNVDSDNVTITVQAAESQNDEEPTIEPLSGGDQRLSEGETSDPLTIKLRDANGQPLSGAEIKWSVVPTGAATLEKTVSRTDSSGKSSNRVTPATDRPGSMFEVLAKLADGSLARFLINPISGISGLTESQQSLAGAFDSACPALQALTRTLTAEEQSMLTTCNYLATASDQDISSTLQQILPDEIAAQGRNSLTLAGARSNNILFRLNALRGGSIGPSFDGLSLLIEGKRLPGIVLSEMNDSLRGGGASADSSILDNRLGIFINGSVTVGDTETTSQEAGYESESDAVTLGLDYRFTSQFVFGAALNYLASESDYSSKSSELDLEGASLSFYGTYYSSEQAFFDAILSYGQVNYKTEREMQISSINHDLSGDTDGSEYALSLGAGYEMYSGSVTFVPQARINYINVQVDSYDESSTGSGLGLSFDEQEIESLLATLSASLSVAFSTEYGVFIPYLSVEWEREYEKDSRAIVARLLNDPTGTDFSVLTNDPDTDYMNVGLGITAAFSEGNSAFLYYEELLEHDYTSQYVVTAGFRSEF